MNGQNNTDLVALSCRALQKMG